MHEIKTSMADATTIYDIETGPRGLADVMRFAPPDKDFDWCEKFYDRAALSPLTGRILAIGMLGACDCTILGNETCDDAGERAMLEEFWALAMKEHWFVGWSNYTFDNPFLMQRSYMLGVKPNWVDFKSQDLKLQWNRTSLSPPDPRRGEFDVSVSLDNVSRALGGPTKNGKGADFHKLWTNPATRDQAREYLRNDLDMTAFVASRLMPQWTPSSTSAVA